MGFQESWFTQPKLFIKKDPVSDVPVKGEKNVLITSALPYVNNVPHLGNIIGCVLSADVFARYCTLKGWRRLFICGTDEYGTATETKALQEGVSPREICDKYNNIHKNIYKWFNIEFDHFGRTSTEHQTELVQDLFLKLRDNGFTTIETIDQLHCERCKRFLADRFVFGECPHCHFEDARGDQCDGCTRLINAVELIKPRCKICGDSPSPKPSTHIFLLLDKLSAEVETFLNDRLSADNHWSTNAVSIAKSWLKLGLEKRCITRDLNWGVPVPITCFSDKVFYVWFDAPVGYLSITKELLGDGWKLWWKNPENVELYNFVGKDNVAFHSVMFPAALLGSRDNYTIVKHLCATEYLNYEDTKFSKSRNTGIFGDMASGTGIEADVWRFYLLYIRPENQDTSFSWDDFALKVNAELLSNLGNFINRALSFVVSSFGGIVPEMELTNAEDNFLTAVTKELKQFDECLKAVRIKEGLTRILAISRLGNQYMQAMQPWVLIKGDESEKKRAKTVIGVACNVAYLLAILLFPYMPEISGKVFHQCAMKGLALIPEFPIAFLRPGHKIGQPKPLFTKIEKAEVEKFKKKFMGTTSEGKDDKKIGLKSKSGRNPKVKEKKISKENKEMSHEGMQLATNHPKLFENMKNIEKLLATVTAKFVQKKELFVKSQLAELGKKKEVLTKEINYLMLELLKVEDEGGVKSISINLPKQHASLVKETSFVTEEREVSNSSKESKGSSKIENLKVDNKNVKQPAKGKGKSKTATGSADDTIDVGRLDLRVGRILKAEKHPDADALYVEQIDLGEEKPRTVVSGLVRHVPLEQMQNRLVICLCNLKPVKMRGIESQAMVMCASCPEKVEILEIPVSCVPGQRISCPNYVNRPDPIMNPKKKIWETVAPDLTVDEEGRVNFKGHLLLVEEKLLITAPTLRNVPVK